MTSMNGSAHSSIYVAPLQINKDKSRAASRSSDRPTTSSGVSYKTSTSIQPQNGQITPPLTPHDSEASFGGHTDFQTYLRAFYPYHPSCEDGSSTVTLPLNSGDLILVHSIHTNGWADGTLLASGTRGWLPTNYCEGYDNEPIRNLLKALTVFWDLVKGSSNGDANIFRSSDYVRGLVAGVRCLLVSLLSLSRVGNGLAQCDGANRLGRRSRSALLGSHPLSRLTLIFERIAKRCCRNCHLLSKKPSSLRML